MQYSLAFSFFYGKKPNGWTNVLLATVCLFIPVVGPLVLLGYQAEVAERLLRDPDLRKHPDFAFDRFTELLTRGLWPFLIGLVAAFVFVPIALIAMFVIPMIGAAANAPIAGMIAAFVCYIVAIFVFNALSIPLQFHAEMANRFDIGGAFRFTMSFLKLVGGKAVVTFFVYFLLSIPITMLGFLACFIGIYPAIVVLVMASQHLMVQLYLEYLDRGGEEIIKTPTDAERRRRRREQEEEDEQYDDEDDRDERR